MGFPGRLRCDIGLASSASGCILLVHGLPASGVSKHGEREPTRGATGGRGGRGAVIACGTETGLQPASRGAQGQGRLRSRGAPADVGRGPRRNPDARMSHSDRMPAHFDAWLHGALSYKSIAVVPWHIPDRLDISGGLFGWRVVLLAVAVGLPLPARLSRRFCLCCLRAHTVHVGLGNARSQKSQQQGGCAPQASALPHSRGAVHSWRMMVLVCRPKRCVQSPEQCPSVMMRLIAVTPYAWPA